MLNKKTVLGVVGTVILGVSVVGFATPYKVVSMSGSTCHASVGTCDLSVKDSMSYDFNDAKNTLLIKQTDSTMVFVVPFSGSIANGVSCHKVVNNIPEKNATDPSYCLNDKNAYLEMLFSATKNNKRISFNRYIGKVNVPGLAVGTNTTAELILAPKS